MSDSQIIDVPLEDLLLDQDNPRLPESVERNPSEIIKYIASKTSIEELITAIGENGYFPGEPVIAYERGGKYIVVEGNRRLTAVMLLNNLSLLEKPSQRIISAVQNAIHRPVNIPTIVRESRESVMPYLGYRHITGVKQWEPLAKARYIKQIFDTTNVSNDKDVRYKEVARIIGSRGDYIRRSLISLECYEIIEQQGFYNIENLDESSIKFSVLSTALADPSIFNYVNNGAFISQKVENLTRWLFERDKDGETVVGESRNLRMLAHVVSDSKATKAIESGASLDYAYRLTSGSNKEFLESLYAVEEELQNAASLLPAIKFDEDALELAREIHRYISDIGRKLKSLKEEVDEDVF